MLRLKFSKKHHPWCKCRKYVISDKIIVCQHRLCRWGWRWS